MRNNLIKLLESKKTLIGLITLAFCESNYAFTNYLTTGMAPHILPLSIVDRWVPFFPTTIWLYLTEVLICIAAFYVAKDLTNLTRYLASMAAVTVAAVAVFVLFPTIFPRIHYPIPQDLNFLTFGLFNWIRKVDYPTNCLPSLHVAYSYLASFVFLQEQRSKFIFFFVWATLIAISTMTTKQHYFIDVVIGLIFACLIYRLFLYLIPNKQYSSLN